MAVNMKAEDKKEPQEEVKPVKFEDIVLVAHNRYVFQGVVFEHQNKYKVSEAQAKTLLALRAANGQPVFIRAKDIKPKVIPVEERGPQKVDVSDKEFIAGMSKERAKQVFNITTPEEDEALEAEISARAQNEGDDIPVVI